MTWGADNGSESGKEKRSSVERCVCEMIVSLKTTL